MVSDQKFIKDLKKADLRYISDINPGITRKKAGDLFKYFDSDRKRIINEAILKRIGGLIIPPAWDKVWICPSPSGYLQATGFDEKGRKQYLYHEEWIKISKENKFNKMVFFGQALPLIRQQIAKDMLLEYLDKRRIMATIIWLLEHTLIRIGNDEYAKDNNSYGLTTLRNRHVTVRGKKVKFEFKGKSGVEQSASISHPGIAKLIKECVELPGYEIFKYLDDQGESHIIDSADVNNYLKELTSEDITAKEFRTWGGTVLCATILHSIGPSKSENDGKKNISQAVKKVSQHLKNTANVCRNYYIHPTVFETYQRNILIPHFEGIYKKYDGKKAKITRPEFATLKLLTTYS